MHVEQFNGFPEQTSHELACSTEEMSKCSEDLVTWIKVLKKHPAMLITGGKKKKESVVSVFRIMADIVSYNRYFISENGDQSTPRAGACTIFYTK